MSRPVGSKNRRTIQRMADAKKGVAGYKLSPKDYLLSVMNDTRMPESLRMEAAKAVAPFVHPRLSAVEVGGELSITHEAALAALK